LKSPDPLHLLFLIRPLPARSGIHPQQSHCQLLTINPTTFPQQIIHSTTMSQDPTLNPPCGPRNMHPRGRGRGRGQGQRHSDPFNYDTQSLPYWDSSLPPSSPIPSTPPRHPVRTYAQIVQMAPPPPKPVQALNPYAEIVGDGPYGKNGATYTTPTPLPTEPKAMRTEKMSISHPTSTPQTHETTRICGVQRKSALTLRWRQKVASNLYWARKIRMPNYTRRQQTQKKWETRP
jgi:hypothetical protein